MKAKCQLCGETIRAERGPMLLNPGTDAATAMAVAEISTFDLLAGRMSQHLEQHADQSAEMVAVAHLAAKVYAMTWAESSDPEYSALREAWRSGILTMLKTTSTPVEVIDGAATVQDLPADAPAATGGGGGVVESNAQKSARKASN